MLLSGGNIEAASRESIGRDEDELKRQIEVLVERGQTPQREALKIEYYRLEIVEALASEQGGSDIPAVKD